MWFVPKVSYVSTIVSSSWPNVWLDEPVFIEQKKTYTVSDHDIQQRSELVTSVWHSVNQYGKVQPYT